MSDPAIEAAQRAWRNNTPVSQWSVAAAREALKPIRDRMDELWQIVGPGGLDVLHELAPMVYPADELKR